MIEKKTYPFELPPLPYAYDALEPYIDEATMRFHHDKHMKTYVDNLNKALESHPELHKWTLEKLLKDLDKAPEDVRTAIRNNGGGVYNHELYFDLMANKKLDVPEVVAKAFGGVDEFKAQMKKTALGQFGSGFAWLVKDKEGKLKIIALPNQDNPLSQGLTPILPLDVWEHAYYLKYQNLRADYIDAWFNVIDWDKVVKSL